MSSRNRYLTARERQQALALSQALNAMRQAALAGETDVEILKTIARNILNAAAITIEYLDVRKANSLQNTHKLGNNPVRAFIAAKIGKTRLIDNMPLEFMPVEHTVPEPSTEESR